MADLRSLLIWVAAGVFGMIGLLIVMRFGVAVGFAMIIAISTPTLAGTALRAQVVALSGLFSGFGTLWLMLVAGEALGGMGLHGSIAGHALFGMVVIAVGALLGLWHLSSWEDAQTRQLPRAEPVELRGRGHVVMPISTRLAPRPIPVRATVQIMSDLERRRLHRPRPHGG